MSFQHQPQQEQQPSKQDTEPRRPLPCPEQELSQHSLSASPGPTSRALHGTGSSPGTPTPAPAYQISRNTDSSGDGKAPSPGLAGAGAQEWQGCPVSSPSSWKGPAHPAHEWWHVSKRTRDWTPRKPQGGLGLSGPCCPYLGTEGTDLDPLEGTVQFPSLITGKTSGLSSEVRSQDTEGM